MDDLSFMQDAQAGPAGNVLFTVCAPDGSYTNIPGVDINLLSKRCPALAKKLQAGDCCTSYTFINKTEAAVISFLRYIYLEDYTYCEAGLEKPCSLLLHLQIYQLADLFYVAELQELVRDYIITEAERFRDACEPMHGFYEGIRFLYTELRHCLDLRRIIAYFCVMRFDHFKFNENEYFRQTACQSRMFHRDLQQANHWTNFCSADAMTIINLPVCHNRIHRENLDFTCILHADQTFDFGSEGPLSFQPLFPLGWTDDSPTWFTIGREHAFNGWFKVLNPSTTFQPLAGGSKDFDQSRTDKPLMVHKGFWVDNNLSNYREVKSGLESMDSSQEIPRNEFKVESNYPAQPLLHYGNMTTTIPSLEPRSYSPSEMDFHAEAAPDIVKEDIEKITAAMEKQRSSLIAGGIARQRAYKSKKMLKATERAGKKFEVPEEWVMAGRALKPTPPAASVTSYSTLPIRLLPSKRLNPNHHGGDVHYASEEGENEPLLSMPISKRRRSLLTPAPASAAAKPSLVESNVTPKADDASGDSEDSDWAIVDQISQLGQAPGEKHTHTASVTHDDESSDHEWSVLDSL